MEPLPVTSRDELGPAHARLQRDAAAAAQGRRARARSSSQPPRTSCARRSSRSSGFVELLQDEDLDQESRREFLYDDERAGRAPPEARGRPARPVAARRRLGRARYRAAWTWRSSLARSQASSIRSAKRTAPSCECDAGDEVPDASCDRERVAQIMRILLDNALRHTPEGTHVTVSASASNGTAEFTVADTGPGLRRARTPRCSSASTRATRPRGAGLGPRDREGARRADGRRDPAQRPAAHGFTLELPTRRRRPREDRSGRAAAAGSAALAAGGNSAATPTRVSRRRAPRQVTTTRRPGDRGPGVGRRVRPGADLRPALARRGDLCRSSTEARACSRTAARRRRARASCSTATATSPRTRTL